MKKSMITTRNTFYRLTASPLFTIIFATIAFILFITASVLDTSVPDAVATVAQYHDWVAEHGEPGDQTGYYIACAGGLISLALSGLAYHFRKWVLDNKYWL